MHGHDIKGSWLRVKFEMEKFTVLIHNIDVSNLYSKVSSAIAVAIHQ